jgi:hypothetical protein
MNPCTPEVPDGSYYTSTFNQEPRHSDFKVIPNDSSQVKLLEFSDSQFGPVLLRDYLTTVHQSPSQLVTKVEHLRLCLQF